ncbi:MAG: type II secretion system F family protein [Phycisphaerae bacterium]|nr:type II secretion system F family protein [Phycisphaerae bacterium]
MAVYAYRAIDPTSVKVKGTIAADTPRQARDQLRQRGLVIEQVAPATGRQPSPARSEGVPRVGSGGSRSGVQLTSFLRELSTLLGVGIPLLESLDTLADQYRGGFEAAVLELREQVAGGAGLAEAMRRRPDIFDELCASITEVGESAGALDQSLAQVADFREKWQQLRGRITTALLYPGIVLLMGLGVMIFLMTYVTPNLLGMLLESGRPLPTTTAMVKAVSDFLIGWWWALLALALAATLAVRMILATDGGGLAWHRFQLRLPGVGELIRKQLIVRIALVVSTLMRNGVEFIQAIQIAQRTTPNRVLREALKRCEQAVYAGQDIGPALEEPGAFPRPVVQVFAVGQHSGRLEPMLERLAMDYDRQVQVAAQRLTAVLEPILIVLLAVMIGLIAFATIIPILEAGDVL